MNVFEIRPDFVGESGVSGTWSPDQTRRSGYKVGPWKPPEYSLLFHDDGRLAAGQAERFGREWLVVTADPLPEFDVIGAFHPDPRSLPAVNSALRAVLEEAAPGTIEFIEIDRVWAEHQNCLIPGGPFHLINLLARRDCWDETAMRISRIPRPDGTSFEVVSGAAQAVRASALEGATIWRERRTLTALCTQHVKSALQAAGCRGWAFRPVDVTSR